MLSLQEISDRLEIQDLMTTYSAALDRKEFDKMDAVFTPDAYIDYRQMGGVDGRWPEIKKYLQSQMQKFCNYYHLVGNMEIKISGDTATNRMICFNPIAPVPEKPGDKPEVTTTSTSSEGPSATLRAATPAPSNRWLRRSAPAAARRS